MGASQRLIGSVLVATAWAATACGSAAPAATGSDAAIFLSIDEFGKVKTDAGVADTGAADAGVSDAAETLGDAVPADGADAEDADIAAKDAGLDVPATCPGAPACSCAGPADCADGLCIDTPEGKRCAVPCGDGCAKDFSCVTLGASSGSPAQVCVPPYGKLCQPCNATEDCKAAGITGALCVDEGTLGRFCGAPCTKDEECPGSYACLVAQSPEGPKAPQCVKLPPAGSKLAYGTCTCTQAAKQQSLSTECYAEQIDLTGKIVGKCPGVRTCGPTGIGPCGLVAPKAEVCDGIDNDCNGQIDENASGCSAGDGCVGGKCVSGCTPVDGGWTPMTYAACSVACGGGTHVGTRTCTQPAPSCGGLACQGSAQTSEACNVQPCVGSDLAKGTTVFSIGEQVAQGTVPAGVTSMAVKLWGGGGAGGYPGNGGGGGYVHATVSVKTGDLIEIRVAGGGGKMGGGGGASIIAKNGALVVIAGGGGGAGVDGCSGCNGNSQTGAGGGAGAAGGTGQAGWANNGYSTNSGGGGGGGQSQGGAGGKQANASAYTGCTADGTPGEAQAGGACAGGYMCTPGPQAKAELGGKACIGNGTGGAGGSGWFGGGSGAAMYTYSGGGGGGGSSSVQAGAVVVASEGGLFAAAGGASTVGYQGDAGAGGKGVPQGSAGSPEAGHAGLIIITL